MREKTILPYHLEVGNQQIILEYIGTHERSAMKRTGGDADSNTY